MPFSRCPRCPVHPRGCGEHAHFLDAWRGLIGSSPRVRGTRAAPGSHLDENRFIPAGAGNTPTRIGLVNPNSVHPRGCGEHSRVISRPMPICGSSPRVRGTRKLLEYTRSSSRFIPAGAGNTDAQRLADTLWTVHPRGCGEHCLGWIDESVKSGSSPRVRGTPAPSVFVSVDTRFIPAGAGNTAGLPYR